MISLKVSTLYERINFSLSVEFSFLSFFSASSSRLFKESFLRFFISLAVDVKIKRLFSENYTVHSSTKYLLST